MDPLIASHWKILDDLHRQIVDVVAPLSDDALNRSVPGLRNTAGILLRHIAGSERYWIGEIVGGRPAHRRRASEFAHDRIDGAAVLAELVRVRALTREVLEELRAPDLLAEVAVERSAGPTTETKAYAVLHAVQHAAFHLGQLRYLVRLLGTG
ncbi:MAG: DinB family protein [Armatimonadota bacterium]|nr:DinB family protein [Armatimonadota bacterium]MDR7484797.1 DinB family protein [Armatimonadota bacterium]MDR7531912.1 DinB family protein [Armatimonadota bacterium]MDR7534743.1 DinB family protein [Armatimonadota bacterium]